MWRVAADNSPFCRFGLCFTSVTGWRLCAASNSPSVGSDFASSPLPAGGCVPLQIRRSVGSGFTLPPLPAGGCEPLQIRRSVGSNFTLPPLPAGGCEPLQIRRSVGSNFTLPPLPADINVINIRLRTILHNLSSTPILLKKPINYRTTFSTKQNPREPQLSGILLYYINFIYFRMAVR